MAVCRIPPIVSILVLLDLALEVANADERETWRHVSILVVVDLALEDQKWRITPS